MSSASGGGIGRWAQAGQQQKQACDVACATDDVEEAVVVPKAYIGRIIGIKGRRLEEIRSKTQVKIRIKDDQVYLRGTLNQREKAKELIEEILAVSIVVTESMIMENPHNTLCVPSVSSTFPSLLFSFSLASICYR